MSYRHPDAAGLKWDLLVARFIDEQEAGLVADVQGAPSAAIPADLGVDLGDCPSPLNSLVPHTHVAIVAASEADQAVTVVARQVAQRM
jgi:hypothetical protein